jgi:hypothetical protein
VRKNLARDAISEEPGNSIDLWNEIHYLDPDLQRAERDQRSSDGMWIIIALLFALLLISGLCLYVRTL